MERNNTNSHLKALSVIIAVIIAVTGWVYVVYNYDPMTRVTYTEVPISFSGEDTLADKGYAVSDASADSMTVTLNQRRIDTGKISSEDISVVADVSDAVEGKNGISLSIMSPDNTQVVDTDIRSISIDVEKANRIEVPIEVDYLDDSDVNSEPIATNLTSSVATVIGAETSITSVERAVAYIGYSDTADGLGVFTRDLVAVSRSGETIPHMVIYPGSVNFTAELGRLKTVNLNLKTVDNSDDNYERTAATEQTIVIKGTSAAVAALESIDTEEIDISYIYESTDIDIDCVLPEGIYLANGSENLKAHVTVAEKKKTKETKED